jgi:hypothetical protein
MLQTKTRELPLMAVAGGAAVLAGVVLWQLGIEFEREWIRSRERPVLGEADVNQFLIPRQVGQIGQASSVDGERRRWVANHHVRGATRASHLTR